MKLHLLLLALLVDLSSGFMTELRGRLAEVACTGEEEDEFISCATKGAAADPIFSEDFSKLEEEAFMNDGSEGRKLQNCDVCPDNAPRGTWCFTMCGRRRLEEVTDTPHLRRLVQQDEFTAGFSGGELTGNGKAKQVAKIIIECMADAAARNPCLGSTNDMTLIVTL
jgi:hypothetical protein